MSCRCPGCSSEMVPHRVGGVALWRCADCEGLWLARGDLLRLRDLPAHTDALLARRPSEASEQPPGSAPARSCARCAEPMTSFSYRGGKTDVERCADCDQIFLERGELGAILYEWEHGLEMSDEARATLDGYKTEGLFKRLLRLDAMMGMAAVVSLVAALRALRYLPRGWRWTGLLPALAFAVVAFFVRRKKLARAKSKVQRALSDHHQAIAASDAAAARAASSTGSKPATSAAATKTAPGRCPWCSAKLARDARRCSACDSDIF